MIVGSNFEISNKLLLYDPNSNSWNVLPKNSTDIPDSDESQPPPMFDCHTVVLGNYLVVLGGICGPDSTDSVPESASASASNLNKFRPQTSVFCYNITDSSWRQLKVTGAKPSACRLALCVADPRSNSVFYFGGAPLRSDSVLFQSVFIHIILSA